MKIAVIYYSRTGNTEWVAQVIAQNQAVILCPLVDKKNRKGFWGYLFAGRDALLKRKTNIEEVKIDLAEFDLFFIGVPNWAATLPPAMRTFLNRHNWGNKKIVFFCTQDSMGAEQVFNNLRQLTKGADIISEKYFNKVKDNREGVNLQVKDWLDNLKQKKLL